MENEIVIVYMYFSYMLMIGFCSIASEEDESKIAIALVFILSPVFMPLIIGIVLYKNGKF